MGKTDDIARTTDNVVDITIEDTENAQDVISRKVLRKIDYRLIPLIFVTCNFFFMDKAILSSAAVFQLREDNHLHGQQYSWASSVFYFGYLLWMYPTSLLCARLPIAKYLATNTLIWGVLVGITAACSSYGGLITVRFLLGVVEATIDPAFIFITSTWYTRDEAPTRTGVWFAGNSIGGIISNLFAYGVGHIKDGLHPWRWMYIVLGEERKFARDRIVIAGTGQTEKTIFRWDQLVECLIDPKTWLLFAITLCAQIPNGGTQNFGNLVIESFGFSSIDSTLIQIPPGVIAASTIAGTGYLAGRYRSLHCLLIISTVLPPICGSAMIYLRSHISKGVQLFGYMLLSTGPAPVPLIMSMVQTNYKGVTKKMTMTALLFFAYCAGNIAGPQLFKSTEAPTYSSAFKAIMICYSLDVVFCVMLRFYLQWMNTKRQNIEGIDGSAGTSGAVAGGKIIELGNHSNLGGAVQEVALREEDYEDVTDWKTVGFRYRY
ncbi:major facilitator superfamily domain-containing protein [Xylogone sp. PMI_703]|nr:major facilitator superfamily domain-containing protein [Xylogone sp. PMI_703]